MIVIVNHFLRIIAGAAGRTCSMHSAVSGAAEPTRSPARNIAMPHIRQAHLLQAHLLQAQLATRKHMLMEGESSEKCLAELPTSKLSIEIKYNDKIKAASLIGWRSQLSRQFHFRI